MEEELPEPKLQQPEEIAAFEVTDPSGNTFKFSGGNFSTELYQLSMCGLSAGTIMEHFGAEHIPTLKDHRALTELALAAIEGKDTEADEKTRNQALSIFYNSILLAYASRTPSGGFGITGERTRDVFSLRNATVDGDYITVDWLVDPVQVKYGDNNYGYECSKRILTKIPSIQGTVVATDDGLYNPETGMPFSVAPSHVGVNPLLHDYINQKISEWGDANRDGIQKAFDTADRNMPELLNPMMLGMTFNLFPELDYSGAVSIIRSNSTYGFSHTNVTDKLGKADMDKVIMICLDEMLQRDPFCVSVGSNNFGDCGMSVRYIERRLDV